MKGSNVNYPAGTNIKVAVEKDTDLQTTPEKLSFDMNPANPHVNVNEKVYHLTLNLFTTLTAN